MKNKFLKTTLVLLSSVAIFYSCQKDAAKNEANILINLNEPHTAVIYFTDHQTPVFDSVFIDMQRLK
ncbi:MAG: hypothetical protein IPM85_12225 [Chitinophagaceae bacterium]|nr:hypothetical protein [Chitinophagaceae bacterium]